MHLVEELPLSFGRLGEGCRLAFIFGGHPVVRHFHEDDILLVLVGHENQVLSKIEQRAVPPRIIRLPDDIVVDAVRMPLVEESLCLDFVAPPVDMNHNQGTLGVASSHIDAVNAGHHQLGKIIPIVRQLAVRPEHPVDDFVAGLNHIRHDAGLPKGDDRIPRVFEHRLYQFGVRLALPCLRDILFARISPGVRVVIVQQEFEAKLIRFFGKSDGVIEVVRQTRWCVEQPQADPVVAVIPEDLKAALSLAIVLEYGALLLGLLKE